MLSDILVVFEDSNKAAGPYALSIARRFGSRITVVRPRRDAHLTSNGSLEMRHELLRVGRESRDAHARQMLEDFGAHARAASVEAEILDFDGPDNLQPSEVGHFARSFDLVIVEQVEVGEPPELGDLNGAILAEAGRPVIVVPGIQRDPARFERIVAAWDGSASSARALGDAAPLLERAEYVEVVTATALAASQPVVSGGERDPANLLLSHVADVSADLIVAGGYGHSRLREAILGGVTRTFMTSMTVPVFMSH
jgi:nucleotide-binding universal stress UspA family protein